MVSQNFVPSARRSRAFTLIELLVSMVVLVIIVLLTSQLVNNASRLTTTDTKHLDADGQARLVFQRLGEDLARMVRRADADCILAKIPLNNASSDKGNDDKLFFYSESPAYFDGDPKTALKSPVALIGYRINNGYQLERLGKTLTWDGAPAAGAGGGNTVSAPGGIVFLASDATHNPLPLSTLSGHWTDTIGLSTDTPTPYSNVTNDADYVVLAEQVFRLEICYLLQPAPHKTTTSDTLQNIAKYSTIPVTAPENVTNKLDATRPPTASDGAPTYQAGSRWYDLQDSRGYVCTSSNLSGNATWKILGAQDVAGLLVTIAVLDTASGKTLPTFQAKLSNSQPKEMPFPDVSKLNAALVDAAGDGSSGSDTTLPDFSLTPPRLPKEAWQNAINQSDFIQKAGIPQAAASQIRIYQRCLSLNALH